MQQPRYLAVPHYLIDAVRAGEDLLGCRHEVEIHRQGKYLAAHMLSVLISAEN